MHVSVFTMGEWTMPFVQPRRAVTEWEVEHKNRRIRFGLDNVPTRFATDATTDDAHRLDLRSPHCMSILATLVVVVFSFSLILFAGVAFANPARAERFLTAFASSARTHYTEQMARIAVGAALVVRSSEMWQPNAFRLFGWIIGVSSVALICIPWQWHARLGAPMRPLLVRYLKPYAVGAFALGVLLLFALFAGGEVA